MRRESCSAYASVRCSPEEQVLRVRRLYESGQRTQTSVAAEYGVTKQAINAAVKGRNWSNLNVY